MREGSNYLLHQDMVELLKEIEQSFPEIIRVDAFESTYLFKQILVVTATLNGLNYGPLEALPEEGVPIMLMTGAHHARELSSISFNLLALLKICHGYLHNHQRTINLLKTSKLIFVPVVNVDGYIFISDIFEQRGIYPLKRKNYNHSADVVCEADNFLELDFFGYGDEYLYDQIM